MKLRFFLIALSALAGLQLPAQTPQSDPRNKIGAEVYAALEDRDHADVLVILREQADLTPVKNIKTKLEKAQFVFARLRETAARSQVNAVRILRERRAFANSLYIVNAVAVERADRDLLHALAALPEVKSIAFDPTVYFSGPVEDVEDKLLPAERGAVEWGIEKINAPAVWALGYRGQGITIGGADTGYDWQHPALRSKYRGFSAAVGGTVDHSYNWHDAIHTASPLNSSPVNPCGFDARKPCDDGSHGTHTMGSMVGDDGQGNQIGVAPGARWIGCRNMERGYGKPSSYIECFQWFLAPTDTLGQKADPSKAPHVINNSWYCSVEEGCNTPDIVDMLRQAVVNLKKSGVFVVVSNGNSGPNCGTTTGPPAYFEESFSVGSTRITDTVSGFSSRGPVLLGGGLVRIKPNVAAPGSNIRSSTPNGGYANFSGTSMAGPHVAGLVALILSAQPKLAGQVETLESLIEKTAVQRADTSRCGIPGTNVPNMAYGFGRVDALAAVKAALSTPTEEPGTGFFGVTVFPNPITERAFFKLENGGGPTVFEVFAPDGKRIFVKSRVAVSQDVEEIELANQPAGAYAWRVSTEKSAATGVILKKH
jgi:serine protease AprX